MKFVLQQGGNESQPLEIEVLDEMIADGRAQTDDQVRPENSDAWVSVAQFVELRKYGQQGSDFKPLQASPSQAAPPPLPGDFPSHDPDRRVPLIGTKTIQGAENMTVRELEQLIREGARIVMFSYCVSILVMTFRRPSPIYLIRPGQSGFGPALRYSLLSVFFGWWGFPWGPIYTIASLVTNAKGGQDLTEPLLSDLVGLEEASRIIGNRQQPIRGGGWKAVGTALATLALVVTLTVAGIRAADEKSEASVPAGPGAAAFVSANQVLRKANASGLGNTDAARAMAIRATEFFNEMHSQVFEGEGADLVRARTHCELHGSKCAFVVYVSKLDSYKTDDSRETLGHLAWLAAQTAVKELSPTTTKIGVGVRNFGGYERVLTGHLAAENEELPGTIENVRTGADSRDALVPLFAEAN